MAELETRSATVTGVRFPERLIDLIVVPYDEPAIVEYRGRLIEEVFAPGAFGHEIARRANRFLVNLEHDESAVVGRCQALYPDRPEGLVAEVRIRRGPEGDQVLDDADDGMVGASVGFGCMPENTRWETRSRRRILKAILGHIGLTFTPAYQGAAVLAVRSSTAPEPAIVPFATIPSASVTPNLDRVFADRSLARYGHG